MCAAGSEQNKKNYQDCEKNQQSEEAIRHKQEKAQSLNDVPQVNCEDYGTSIEVKQYCANQSNKEQMNHEDTTNNKVFQREEVIPGCHENAEDAKEVLKQELPKDGPEVAGGEVTIKVRIAPEEAEDVKKRIQKSRQQMTGSKEMADMRAKAGVWMIFQIWIMNYKLRTCKTLAMAEKQMINSWIMIMLISRYKKLCDQDNKNKLMKLNTLKEDGTMKI